MKEISPDKMCFGLDPDLDKASFACFLRLVGAEQFSTKLAERISEEEMNTFLDNVYTLLKNHFSESEYHSIFLQDIKKKKCNNS